MQLLGEPPSTLQQSSFFVQRSSVRAHCAVEAHLPTCSPNSLTPFFGAAVGSATGVLVPLLHRARLPVVPGVSASAEHGLVTLSGGL